MDKTLGQIAHEAGEKYGGWVRKWGQMHPGQKAEWEDIAQAIAAAVKEEDARICGDVADEQIGMAYESIADDCASAIRASIKP